MSDLRPFLPLPEDWEPTRAALHSYTHALAAVARASVPAHPKWWHVSLSLAGDTLTTDPIPLSDGSHGSIRLDLGEHRVEVVRGSSVAWSHSLAAGLSAAEFAGMLFASAVSDLGLTDEFDRSRVAGTEKHSYDPDHASAFLEALTVVAAALTHHRASLPGEPGPVQLWPHGFDIAFEWFGTRQVPHTEEGETELLPAQLNLGWYPAGDAYFYSNPWPFDEDLLAMDLPHGARWHTDGWQGSELGYAALAGIPDGPARFLEYASAVFAMARPSLTA